MSKPTVAIVGASADRRKLGLNAIAGCSIVNVGVSPSELPDA